MEVECYEDQFSRAGRWLRRLTRTAAWHARGAAGARKNLLVELRWRLGDELMALPVFEALSARHPRAHIAVLTHFPALFEGSPHVDAVNVVPPRVDRYILLRGAPRTAPRLAHCAKLAGVPRPEGRPKLYFGDWNAPQLPQVRGSGPLVALATGTTWKTKRWRTDRWRALGAALAAGGCRLVELGQGHAPAGVGTCLVDQTTVRETACILHAADVLVSCDSGLMHLALAAGTPVIALFGPTVPMLLVQDEPLLTPLRSTLECSGYWNREDVSPEPGVCPWEHPCCLDSITVDAVLAAVRRVLARRAEAD